MTTRVRFLDRWLNPKLDRRRFLKVTAAAAGSAAAAGTLLRASTVDADPDAVDGDSSVNLVRSTCQMCHGRCGISAKVQSGVLLKLDGNPYNAQNMDPDEQVPPSTDPDTGSFRGVPVKHLRGRLCPRGQAGIQSLYNPYRVTTPLRRVGARGAGHWEPISWSTAISEIAAKINALIPPADRNTKNIDDAVPELGKIANQLLVAPGRTVEGLIWERVFKSGFGTSNWRLDHTSICEASHHVAGRMVSTGGTASGKHGWFSDHPESAYTVIVGANPMEANFAMVPLARSILNMKEKGGKLVVVDPRFSASAAKADKWVPIRPGSDGAFFMGLARHLLESNKHRLSYLENANKAAANADQEPTYTDATWLVATAGSNRGRLLSPLIANGSGSATDRYIWNGTEGVAFTPSSTSSAATGALEPGTVTVGTNAVECTSVFALYRAEVYKRTVAQWASLCGVPEADIRAIADELSNPAYGRKTAMWGYRGVVQTTNGTYNQLCLHGVNSLLGNFDYRGGITTGAPGSDENNSSGPGGQDLKKFGPGVTAMTASGPRMDRAGTAYSAMSNLVVRDGYPATRPWFPFAALGTYQEIIPGIQDGYPYPAKVLITYWNAFPYSVPSQKAVFAETVGDEAKLPLFVAIDPIIGENSAYADYILPDTTYLEKWSIPHGGNAAALVKNEPFQQPVVGKLDGAAIGSVPFNANASNAFESFLGPNGPRMALDIVRDLGVALNLPGIGANAFPDGGSFDRAWDLVKRMLTNVANNAGTTVADIVSKGGAFTSFDQAYADFGGTVSPSGNYLKTRYGGERHFYVESLVTTRQWFEDAPYAEFGVPIWEPIKHLDGTPVKDHGYPLTLITYKKVLHGQARTHTNAWLMAFEPENAVELSAPDARALGIVTGDWVRIRSASSPTSALGRALVVQGLRPGVVAVSHSFGHWEGGATPQVVTGSARFASNKSEDWRAAGIAPNPIMRADDMFPNVSLEDRLGGSVSFSNSPVIVEKVSA